MKPVASTTSELAYVLDYYGEAPVSSESIDQLQLKGYALAGRTTQSSFERFGRVARADLDG